MKTRFLLILGLFAASLTLVACETKPPCKTGELSAPFASGPAASALPKADWVTVCADSEGENHAKLWEAGTVHSANMRAVDLAQNNGWDRLSDNWHGSVDTSDRPKWSELQNESGDKLRIDIKPAEEGAYVEYTYTPAE